MYAEALRISFPLDFALPFTITCCLHVFLADFASLHYIRYCRHVSRRPPSVPHLLVYGKSSLPLTSLRRVSPFLTSASWWTVAKWKKTGALDLQLITDRGFVPKKLLKIQWTSVDAGILLTCRYLESSRMSALEEVWVSKASAKQRQGRAGRVREGHCFRLYTRDRSGCLLTDVLWTSYHIHCLIYLQVIWDIGI